MKNKNLFLKKKKKKKKEKKRYFKFILFKDKCLNHKNDEKSIVISEKLFKSIYTEWGL
jgi:hypothetical protein